MIATSPWLVDNNLYKLDAALLLIVCPKVQFKATINQQKFLHWFRRTSVLHYRHSAIS